jgi:hypothetical protein
MSDTNLKNLNTSILNNSYPPTILSRIVFLDFLQEMFFGAPSGNFRWNKDEQLTEVLIRDSWTRDTDSTGKIPLIIVSRSSMAPAEMFLNNSMSSYNIAGDNSKHADILSVNMIFTCRANDVIISETLASTVYQSIKYYKEELLRRGLMAIKNYRIDPPEPAQILPGESKIERIDTRVSCVIYMVDRWQNRWKTTEEFDNYVARTGIDPRTNNINIPPHTLGAIEIREGIIE